MWQPLVRLGTYIAGQLDFMVCSAIRFEGRRLTSSRGDRIQLSVPRFRPLIMTTFLEMLRRGSLLGLQSAPGLTLSRASRSITFILLLNFSLLHKTVNGTSSL
jgi:hypothetical protein